MHFLFELFDNDGAKTIEGHLTTPRVPISLQYLRAYQQARWPLTGCVAPWQCIVASRGCGCVAAHELIEIMESVGLDMSASDDMEYVAVAVAL
jgi:hypothetical protein